MVCTKGGGNQSWNGVVKRFSATRCDWLFVLVADGRRWFIPASEVGGGSAIMLGGPKDAAYEVDPGRPLAAASAPSPLNSMPSRWGSRAVKGDGLRSIGSAFAGSNPAPTILLRARLPSPFQATSFSSVASSSTCPASTQVRPLRWNRRRRARRAAGRGRRRSPARRAARCGTPRDSATAGRTRSCRRSGDPCARRRPSPWRGRRARRGASPSRATRTRPPSPGNAPVDPGAQHRALRGRRRPGRRQRGAVGRAPYRGGIAVGHDPDEQGEDGGEHRGAGEPWSPRQRGPGRRAERRPRGQRLRAQRSRDAALARDQPIPSAHRASARRRPVRLPSARATSSAWSRLDSGGRCGSTRRVMRSIAAATCSARGRAGS